MQLREWRKAQKLTLAVAGKLFGLSISGVSELETGKFSRLHLLSVARIAAVTKDEVTLADHWVCWGKRHVAQFTKVRADGRAALKKHRSPPKTRKARKK